MNQKAEHEEMMPEDQAPPAEATPEEIQAVAEDACVVALLDDPEFMAGAPPEERLAAARERCAPAVEEVLAEAEPSAAEE